jgi:hypothetical protein
MRTARSSDLMSAISNSGGLSDKRVSKDVVPAMEGPSPVTTIYLTVRSPSEASLILG